MPDFHHLPPYSGQWEEVRYVDTNPRPPGYEGVWGNGTTTWHCIGAVSGLICIQKTSIRGGPAWFDKEGNEYEWGSEPQFKTYPRSEMDPDTNPELVSSVTFFD